VLAYHSKCKCECDCELGRRPADTHTLSSNSSTKCVLSSAKLFWNQDPRKWIRCPIILNVCYQMRMKFIHSLIHSRLSQAARQGLAVLMATAVVVLKHETSTIYQSHLHIYESTAKFGEDRFSGGAPTWR